MARRPKAFPPRQRGRLEGDRREAREVDKGDGRRERRTLTTTTILRGYADWPGLAQVFRLTRERTARGQAGVEVAHGITSLGRDRADARRLLGLVRRRWGIEVVSPGNKSSRIALGVFIEKVAEILDLGLHMLILDPHRPGRRDPQGIHGAINQQLNDTPYQAPPDQPLTLAAYTAGPPVTSYVEPVAVGDTLPPMPLFLDEENYVDMPLEATYRAAWLATPRRWRDVIEPPPEGRSAGLNPCPSPSPSAPRTPPAPAAASQSPPPSPTSR